MPPKMSDRVEALEEKMAAMEVSVRQSLAEFRQSILEEFAKLHTERHDDRQTSPFLGMEYGAEYKMSAKKVELPSFDGTDLVGW